MRESMDTFIKSSRNASVFKELDSLNKLRPMPLKLFIQGPHHAGKSALIRGWTEDALRDGAGDAVFVCSGADIAMALQFEADDSFFEKLGDASVLLIDDFEPLIRTEKGDQLLSLLLAERERQGFSTVITSRKPLTDYELEDSAELLASFDTLYLEPLDNKEKCAFVNLVASEYSRDSNSVLSDEAAACIVDLMGDSFADMENAARYLATDDDCGALNELDAPTVMRLLKV